MLYDAVKRLAPDVYFEIHQDGTHDNQPYISLWLSTEPMPSQVEIDAMIATLEAEREAATTEQNALRTRVVNLAQSAVGIQIDALTQAQMRALIAILLRKEGALNPDGSVRSLGQWVR